MIDFDRGYFEKPRVLFSRLRQHHRPRYLRYRDGEFIWLPKIAPNRERRRAIIRAVTLPTLPTATVDTTYSLPTGTTWVCATSAQLTSALSSAALGDVIQLQAGNTFVGPFQLPNKASGSGWIYVVTSAYGNLPAPGVRVAPSDASNMPKITGDLNYAFYTAANAHHFRFVGLEVTNASSTATNALFQIGNGETTLGTLPHDITIDRCYVHGSTTLATHRGIAGDATSFAVIDSYVSSILGVSGTETQAIWAFNAPGPFKYQNNYLEATGENVMFGGADPFITDLVPSDITIQYNTFFKQPSWVGAGYGMKNLLEFKNAQRVLVQGNYFTNSFPDAQNGMGVLLTPRNQSGTAPQSCTWDITVRLNKMTGFSQGWNISGRDSGGGGGGLGPSQITNRVLFENNELVVDGNGGSNGFMVEITNGPINLTIRHNTGILTSGGLSGWSENSPVADLFDERDNVWSNGSAGFSGTGTGEGNATLNTYYTNYTYTGNVQIASINTGNYPAGNFFPANNAAVGFTDFAGGDYSLTPASAYHNAATDGKDCGCDFVALVAALAGAAPGGGGGGKIAFLRGGGSIARVTAP